jgi:plastocyanin
MSINFPNSPTLNQIYSSNETAWQWDGIAWNVINTSIPISLPNSFSSILVAGNDPVVATIPNDDLTLTAGSNITLASDPSTRNIVISSAGGVGGSSNSFGIISVPGQANVIADQENDTLTIQAGAGIQISTNATNDTITIEASSVGGASNFNQLSDATLASLTIDQIYLPAITSLNVTNIGATSYRFDQYGSTNNPTIYTISGTTIAFKINATGHPLLIQNSAGANFNTGLIHVSTTGVVSTGVSAQAKDSGTLYWKIPADVSGSYRYQCSLHAPMVGLITVKSIITI